LFVISCAILYFSHINTKEHRSLQSATIELRRATIEQMQKDFRLSGYSYIFINEDAEELIEELTHFLKKQDQIKDLKPLFYHIDLRPEHYLQASGDYHKLSVLLWNRVFQKVLTRKIHT
jgi:hypothetical protein